MSLPAWVGGDDGNLCNTDSVSLVTKGRSYYHGYKSVDGIKSRR